jgi:hypothetical protein
VMTRRATSPILSLMRRVLFRREYWDGTAAIGDGNPKRGTA